MKAGEEPCGDAGSIGDLFTSLGTPPPLLGERYAALKERIRPDAVTLSAAWARLQAAVAAGVAELRQKGSAVIPSVDFSAIEANGGRLPPEVADEVRRRGCCVVRNTVSREEALGAKGETREYLRANAGKLTGFPKDKPQVWEVYWARPQLRLRQHPRMVATQRALNRLWHCRPLPAAGNQVRVDVHRPLTYCDRLRIRDPGDSSFTLGPHVDGGSTERWEDDEYRRVYADILEGHWERYDPFDATHRAEAKQDLYNSGLGGCSLFRTFQGWVSLSEGGQGLGALQVVPLLKEATAFLLLRPFLPGVPATSFCGANPGKVKDLFPEFHQDLIAGLVPIPRVEPGDTVWWHCDLIHAVEGTHGGVEDSSVFYIPAVPLCARNAAYIQKQAGNFIEGKTPPDFPPNHSEVAALNRGVPSDLHVVGKMMMGLSPWPPVKLEGETDIEFEASEALREECCRLCDHNPRGPAAAE